MWNRILAILWKEFFQTLRDPRRRSLLIGPPLLQLVLFGYAVNLDVEHAPIAWMDMDRTPESRELLAAFQGSRYFRITALPATDNEVQDLMDHGKVQAVLRVLPGYARDVKRGNSASVQILVDGTNSNTASIVASYATQIVLTHATQTLAARQNSRLVGLTAKIGGAAPAVIPVLTAQSRVWFNPDLVSRVYFVPGVIVNIIALVTIMLTSMSIVREKEIGTMEQLMVTPVKPLELIMGKLLPFAVVGVVEVALVVVAALPDISCPDPGQHTAAVWLLSVVPALHPRSRPLYFDHLANPAAGDDVVVFLLHAGYAAERICLPDPEYAARGSIFDLSESASLFHADCAGPLFKGCGYCIPLAGDPGPLCVRRGYSQPERPAVS